MKWKLFFVLSAFWSPVIWGQHTIAQRVYTEGDLPALFAGIGDDPQLQFERLASWHFHQLINQYRQSRGKKTLYWDDRLWLAARNHNLYMESLGDITHGESAKNEFYTGGDQGARMRYASYGLLAPSGNGENVVLFGGWDERTNESAAAIALEAFEMWKASDGHNKNMLENMYFAHGTALNMSDMTWGTTVFCYAPASFTENEISITWDENLAASLPPLFEVNGAAFREHEWSLKLDEFALYNLLKQEAKDHLLENNKAAAKSSKMHLLYLLNEKTTGLNENKAATSYYGKNSKKRYLKAGHYAGIFSLVTHQVHELSFQLELEEEELKNKSGFIRLQQLLRNEYAIPAGADSWGGIVQLIDSGGRYTCMVDVVCLVRK